MIVIHHTGSEINGNPYDDDHSAKEIDQWHKNAGWSMIGYHFVIRKNGSIERGRPEWTIGSHAYGENFHTLGIHLCGNFNAVKPTDQQIEMSAMLIANLCDKYNIPTDKDHIVGHRDLMSTDCPGKNLYDLLPTIIGKANFYRYTVPDAVIKNIIEIQSDTPISEETLKKIKDILINSKCANESLRSLPNFTSYDERHIIKFGEEPIYITTIEI